MLKRFRINVTECKGMKPVRSYDKYCGIELNGSDCYWEIEKRFNKVILDFMDEFFKEPKIINRKLYKDQGYASVRMKANGRTYYIEMTKDS